MNYRVSTSIVDEKDHVFEEGGYDNPWALVEMNRAIRTRTGESGPSYEANYQWKELEKMRNRADSRASRMVSPSKFSPPPEGITWTERGPANIPGRTVDMLIDPDDPTHNTWFAVSAGGGVWKTTDKGNSWRWLTPTISYLVTTSIAMAPSNHNFILLGTGGGALNSGYPINGGVIFASYDRGETWTLLNSTRDFSTISRIIIDPNNENVIVVATSNGIYRSVDKGINWTNVYSSAMVEDIQVRPNNYLIQYAFVYYVGIIKSIDGGKTWNALPQQYVHSNRSEIAISPVNSDIVFVVHYYTEGATDVPELFISKDAGDSWEGVELKKPGGGDGLFSWFLYQGWFNNSITCHPYNSSKIYVGGVDAHMIDVDLQDYSQVEKNYYTINADKNIFEMVEFSQDLGIRRFPANESQKFSVEIRFGPNKSQKAHRFTVPLGSTSGLSYNSYVYKDYVSVPFEVWDVTSVPARQLMVSFRDQGNDGRFNLIRSDFYNDDPLKQSRESILVHDVNYNSSTPSDQISKSEGGFGYKEMYSVWPVLSSNLNNEPNPYPNTTIEYKLTKLRFHKSTSYTIVPIISNDYVHVDQHYISAIKENEGSKTFRILFGNDGGVASTKISTQPGEVDNDFYDRGLGYNTTLFHGVDKKPGADVYIGGTQDNGTLRSKFGIETSSLAQYDIVSGGDGFEAIWNAKRADKVMCTSQYGFVGLSLDAGETFSKSLFADATTFPFFTRLSSSDIRPDSIYTISKTGVWRSFDFGQNWTITELKEKFSSAATMFDVEVSKANPDIVWAGAGMDNNNSLHVSTDGGVTFTKTQNSALANGPMTSLASHPSEENTAYALFSIHAHPKILCTKDLGRTWDDLSGFNTNQKSNNGFPDVAVHTLYVHPKNNDRIWAGTEIGIVETLDGGLSWHLVDGFPNVKVWELKGRDGYIIIATYGRGIWTALVNPVTLNVVVVGEGEVTPLSGKSYEPNTKVTLTANPATGYRFDRWEVGETTYKGMEQRITLTANPTVATAYFIQQVNLTKGTAPAEQGSYTVAPEHNDLGTYDINTKVTLTATPATGYRFDRWEVGETTYKGMEQIITLAKNTVATAYFIQQVTLTKTEFPAEQGIFTITPAPNANLGTYDINTKITLNATPATGYVFVKWEVGSTTYNTQVQEITLIDNTVVKAYFEIEAPVLAIDNFERHSVSYPNPAYDHLTVPTEGIASVVLRSTDGRVVYQSLQNGNNTIEIDLSAFSSGIYFLQLLTADGSVSTSIIVKN